MTCEKSANGRSAGNNAASRVDPNGRSGRLADLWLRGGMSRRGDTGSQLEADSPSSPSHLGRYSRFRKSVDPFGTPR